MDGGVEASHTLPDWVLQVLQKQAEQEQQRREEAAQELLQNAQLCRADLEQTLDTQLPGWRDRFDLMALFTGNCIAWQNAITYGKEQAFLRVKGFSTKLRILCHHQALFGLCDDDAAQEIIWIALDTDSDDAWQRVGLLLAPLLEKELEERGECAV